MKIISPKILRISTFLWLGRKGIMCDQSHSVATAHLSNRGAGDRFGHAMNCEINRYGSRLPLPITPVDTGIEKEYPIQRKRFPDARTPECSRSAKSSMKSCSEEGSASANLTRWIHAEILRPTRCPQRGLLPVPAAIVLTPNLPTDLRLTKYRRIDCEAAVARRFLWGRLDTS